MAVKFLSKTSTESKSPGGLYFLLKDQHFPWSNFLLKNRVEKHPQVPTAQSQQPNVYKHH